MPIKINPTADRCVDDDDLKRRSFYRAVHLRCYQAGKQGVPLTEIHVIELIKNVLHASDIMEQTPLGQNGRLTEIRCRYECEFYVHAVALRETLETITGNAYRIEQNGHDGWLVTV